MVGIYVIVYLKNNLDAMGTMTSSRRFGASSELKLQRTLRRLEGTGEQPTLTMTGTGDTSTRFDREDVQDRRIRDEIERKRKVRCNQLVSSIQYSCLCIGSHESLERRNGTFRCYAINVR